MYLIPTLDIKEDVLAVLNKIELSEELGAAGY